jgi:hypothetical protein
MRYGFAPRLAAALLGTLWLASCAKFSGSPWYEAPPGLTAATGATVSHSDNPAAGTAPDGDTRVVTIDGLPVDAMHWDEIVLPAGDHSLGVEYNGASSQADVTIHAALQAGTVYTVNGERSGPCDAKLWLQEKTSGRLLGPKHEMHLYAKPIATGAPPFAVACD